MCIVMEAVPGFASTLSVMKFHLTPLIVLLMAGLFQGCTEKEQTQADRPTDTAESATNVVQIIARGLAFDAPSEIPSGWTTFRLDNRSELVHFAIVERLPEGHTVEQAQKEVVPPFQAGMDRLNEGDVDAAMEAFGSLPEWFSDLVFIGGPGLTAGGSSSEATVFLEPGNYMIECYVKTDGVFHSYNPDPDTWGMVSALTVTEERNGEDPPESTVEVSVSAANGIVLDQPVRSGEQTFAVFFMDQQAHENFVGHDVHLARVHADTDHEQLQNWMDWTQPSGLETPAPVTFLGGLNEMPAGQTGYFTVSLDPGSYILISETPGASDKGLMHSFEVD